VHNHHPMINNVAKFLSKFSSTSSSATTTSPWRCVSLVWLSFHCFWRATPLRCPYFYFASVSYFIA
jgi:hypothetical protein